MTVIRKPNLPFDEYCAIEAINASVLKGNGQYSPKHLKAALDGEMENNDSKDRRLGRAIHCMILEPERFAKDFPLAELTCEAIVKSTKKRCDCGPTFRLQSGEWRCGTHKNRTETAVNPETGKNEDVIVEVAEKVADYVTPYEQSRIKKLSNSIRGEPAGTLLSGGDIETELTIAWEQFGFQLKTRIDFASMLPRRIVELKKMLVGKGRDADLKRECGKRGYHIQAWFQIAAYVAAHDGIEFDAFAPVNRPEMWFLFSEDSAPFCCNALEVHDADLQIAQLQISELLDAYDRCRISGKFYGYQMVLNPDKKGITDKFFREPFMNEVDIPPEADDGPVVTFGGEELS